MRACVRSPENARAHATRTHVGFALSVGTLLLKTYRISAIFHSKKHKTARISDLKLGCVQPLLPGWWCGDLPGRAVACRRGYLSVLMVTEGIVLLVMQIHAPPGKRFVAGSEDAWCVGGDWRRRRRRR